MNKPPYGDSLRRSNLHNKMFEVTAQNLPAKNVKVAAGSFWRNGTTLVEFIGANTADIQPPTTGAKWVVIALSGTGQLYIADGNSATNDPVVPTLATSYLPLAAIYYKASDTVITNDMIFDVRPIFSTGVAPVNHADILNRTVADSHSIASITGLQAALDTKITQSAIDVLSDSINQTLQGKCDSDGTTSSEFILNKDETGAAASDALITINRGNLPNVSIKWNETDDHWEYTNDGIDWHSLSISGSVDNASTSVKGVTRLSAVPNNSLQPIAVGDNDTRLLTNQEKTDILAHVEDTTTDPHGVIALLNTSNLPTHEHEWSDLNNTPTDVAGYGITDVYTKTAADLLLGAKADSSSVYTKGEANLLLDDKANSVDVYTKAAADLLLADKADVVDVYTKLEVTNLITDKANSADVYTKVEADLLLADKANTSDVNTALGLKADSADVYTKTAADLLLGDKANSVDVYTKSAADLAFAPASHDHLTTGGALGDETVGTNQLVDEAVTSGKLAVALLANLVQVDQNKTITGDLTFTTNIILTDTVVPANKYRLSVASGALVATLIV